MLYFAAVMLLEADWRTYIKVTLCFVPDSLTNCCWLCIFSDIDECQDGSHMCRYTQICQNTVGGYGCICPRGYRSQGVGLPCLGMTSTVCSTTLIPDSMSRQIRQNACKAFFWLISSIFKSFIGSNKLVKFVCKWRHPVFVLCSLSTMLLSISPTTLILH